MTAEYRFGFLKQHYSLAGTSIEVHPLDDLDTVVKEMLAAPFAGPTSFHPPLVRSSTDRITRPTERFELPETHRLVTLGRANDPEFGEFLILILGFVLGLRLTIKGTGHLQATPHEVGTLVSFRPTRREVGKVLEHATLFWDNHPPEMRKLLFGAVHYFLIAQGYGHQHERFAWMYTVMDNLHRVAWHTNATYQGAIQLKGQHSERPKALSSVFGSPLPASFIDPSGRANNVDRLVLVRNELIHEARWAGEPLGYAVSGEGHDLFMEMTFFCSQIILGLLDADCQFRKSICSRQVHGLDMAP